MANTLGQEENLMGQTINKDGFIVPDEERNFTKLLVNLELADNLQDMNPSIGITQPNFIKIREAETVVNEPVEPIKLGTLPPENDPFHVEYTIAQRINLQFQNRFNEVMANQINTAFAPQILSTKDLDTVRSFPKLQNEMEAIDEYAKTHYLTPDQIKTLKQELIKRNFKDYTDAVEATRGRQRDKINRPPQPPAGGQAQPPPAGGRVPPPPPPPPATKQAPQRPPGEQAQPPPAGGQAQPPPAAGAGGGDEDREIEQPMVFPPNPDFGQYLELDKQQNPADFIDGRQKVNVNIMIDANKYKNMAESYMKNYFVIALYKTSLVNGKEQAVNKFLSWFVKNNAAGKVKLMKNYDDILSTMKNADGRGIPAYFKDFVRNINASVESFSNGQQLIYMKEDDIELPTVSQLQKNKLIDVLINILSKCRVILDKNLEIFGFAVNRVDSVVLKNVSNYSELRKREKIYFVDTKDPRHNPNYLPIGYKWKL